MPSEQPAVSEHVEPLGRVIVVSDERLPDAGTTIESRLARLEAWTARQDQRHEESWAILKRVVGGG